MTSLIAELERNLPGIRVLPIAEAPGVMGMRWWRSTILITDEEVLGCLDASVIRSIIVHRMAEDLAFPLRRRVYGRNRAVVVSDISWEQSRAIEQGCVIVMARVNVGVMKIGVS